MSRAAVFVLGLLKIGGVEMCDILLGVPGCVTKCDRGSKLAKNSVTYFMDGPLGVIHKGRPQTMSPFHTPSPFPRCPHFSNPSPSLRTSAFSIIHCPMV